MFLGLSILLALVLFKYSKIAYTEFTLWIWTLSPFLRRVTDLKSGYNSRNLIIIVPLAVTLVSGLSLAKLSTEKHRKIIIPLFLILSALGYGYMIGLFNVGLFSATYDFSNWFVPLIFGFHVLVTVESPPQMLAVFKRSFLWIALVVGSYGICQFRSPQPWDTNWMINSQLHSIGLPLPYLVRVFSTLNAPGPCAAVLMCSLLLIFDIKSYLVLPVAFLGFASFLLTSVRACWGGWLLGFIYIVSTISMKSKVKVAAGLVILITLTVPVLSNDEIQNKISKRLNTVNNLQNDVSFKSRMQFFWEILDETITDPIGKGLGSTGLASTIGQNLNRSAAFDNGLLNLFYSLGWPGGTAYLYGLVLILTYAFTKGRKPNLLASPAVRVVPIAVASQMIFGNVGTGISGIVLWSFSGLAIALKNQRADYPLRSSKKRSEEDINLGSNISTNPSAVSRQRSADRFNLPNTLD